MRDDFIHTPEEHQAIGSHSARVRVAPVNRAAVFTSGNPCARRSSIDQVVAAYIHPFTRRMLHEDRARNTSQSSPKFLGIRARLSRMAPTPCGTIREAIRVESLGPFVNETQPKEVTTKRTHRRRAEVSPNSTPQDHRDPDQVGFIRRKETR